MLAAGPCARLPATERVFAGRPKSDLLRWWVGALCFMQHQVQKHMCA